MIARCGIAGLRSGTATSASGISAAVDDDGTELEIVEQLAGCTTVMLLPQRLDQANRQAMLVDHCVDRCARPYARTTDGIIRPPFFCPSGVLVGANDGGVDQKRLWTVVCGP